MTLPELHLECASIALPMSGPHRHVMLSALSATAPATAWARNRATIPIADLYECDLDSIVTAFGTLTNALHAVGLRLHDGTVRASAWSRSGMQDIAVS